jgi:hypothetical protein
MASQRPVYYEQELEEDINDANLDMAIGNYGQNIYDTGSFYAIILISRLCRS